MATKTKDVAKTEEILQELVPQDMAKMFDLKENMEGVAPEFPAIKIIHQGQIFEMPDGRKVDNFQGIMLLAARANAYWETSYDESGGGDLPDCFSHNGVTPEHHVEKPQATDCAECPKNQYGTAEKGTGKACKNMKRIFILLEGEALPSRLTASPNNLKPTDKYITSLTSKGIPYQLAESKFTLIKAHNKDGVEYSQLKIEHVGTVTDKVRADEIKDTFHDLKDTMRQSTIAQSDMG